MEKTHTISYQEYAIEELSAEDLSLLQAAIKATATSYAPYSNFHVGAAVLMADGSVVMGSNQENAAYPSGLCAERTALFSAAAQHPGVAVRTIAIVARNPQGTLAPACPCGACRQVMSEQELRQSEKMRVICYFSDAKILIFEGIENLLPFGFDM